MLHYGSEAGKPKIKGTLFQSWDPDHDAVNYLNQRLQKGLRREAANHLLHVLSVDTFLTMTGPENRALKSIVFLSSFRRSSLHFHFVELLFHPSKKKHYLKNL